MRPGLAIIALWIVWAISWLAGASWQQRTEKRASVRAEVAYRLVLVVGVLVLAIPAHGYAGPLRLWHVTWVGAWVCVAAIALGFALTWWARIRIGPLWPLPHEIRRQHADCTTSIS